MNIFNWFKKKKKVGQNLINSINKVYGTKNNTTTN